MVLNMKLLAVAWWAACAAAAAAAQPECSVDLHCNPDHFCSSSKCVQCLGCGEYNRHVAAACAKAVGECGSCLPGYKPGHNLECVDERSPEPAEEAGGGLPTYVWVPILVLVLLLLLLLLACVPRLMRAKLFSWTGDSAATYTSPCDAEAPLRSGSPLPPAYPPPPPYNPATNNNCHPSSPPHDKAGLPFRDEPASLRPFVEQGDSPHVHSGHRERDTNQAARPFNYPSYVRPPRYDEVVNDDVVNEEPLSPELADDEATVESPWTPGPPISENSTNLPALLNEALSEAHGNPLIRQPDRTLDPTVPPSKRPRLLPAQDITDNHSGGAGEAVAAPAAPPALPAAHTVGSNGIPLRPDRAPPAADPRRSPSPPSDAPSTQTGGTNITIHINQNMMNIVPSRIRYDNEPR